MARDQTLLSDTMKNSTNGRNRWPLTRERDILLSSVPSYQEARVYNDLLRLALGTRFTDREMDALAYELRDNCPDGRRSFAAGGRRMCGAGAACNADSTRDASSCTHGATRADANRRGKKNPDTDELRNQHPDSRWRHTRVAHTHLSSGSTCHVGGPHHPDRPAFRVQPTLEPGRFRARFPRTRLPLGRGQRALCRGTGG